MICTQVFTALSNGQRLSGIRMTGYIEVHIRANFELYNSLYTVLQAACSGAIFNLSSRDSTVTTGMSRLFSAPKTRPDTAFSSALRIPTSYRVASSSSYQAQLPYRKVYFTGPVHEAPGSKVRPPQRGLANLFCNQAKWDHTPEPCPQT